MAVPIAFLRTGPLKRAAYSKIPEWVEKGNIAWKLSNPMYGMSTACKDWCETIRDFLAEESVCGEGYFPG